MLQNFSEGYVDHIVVTTDESCQHVGLQSILFKSTYSIKSFNSSDKTLLVVKSQVDLGNSAISI